MLIMKNLKKLAASIAALATAISLSIGALAVTANEIKKDINKTFAEKAFVASFTNEEYNEVAKYLIDNGVKLSDAQLIMSHYVNANKNKNPNLRAANSNTYTAPYEFYNTSYASKCQHYGVIMADTGKLNNLGIDFYLEFNNPIINFSEYKKIKTYNAPNQSNVLTSSYIDSIAEQGTGEDNCLYVTGNVVRNLPQNKPTEICDFPFNVVSSSSNESYLHSMIRFEACKLVYTTYPATKIIYPQYKYETYIAGDINHNGIVDDDDLDWIVKYNIGNKRPIKTNYIGMTPEKAYIINSLAADADHNGMLDLSDVTMIAKYIQKENQ